MAVQGVAPQHLAPGAGGVPAPPPQPRLPLRLLHLQVLLRLLLQAHLWLGLGGGWRLSLAHGRPRHPRPGRAAPRGRPLRAGRQHPVHRRAVHRARDDDAGGGAGTALVRLLPGAHHRRVRPRGALPLRALLPRAHAAGRDAGHRRVGRPLWPGHRPARGPPAFLGAGRARPHAVHGDRALLRLHVLRAVHQGQRRPGHLHGPGPGPLERDPRAQGGLGRSEVRTSAAVE
mmetsp:Transcript_491/g.1492  ORF Transcript_491/g.1492 Transcript_491/m.1492 type:complete len:230 (-) Transcript_491:548-1237(-)